MKLVRKNQVQINHSSHLKNTGSRGTRFLMNYVKTYVTHFSLVNVLDKKVYICGGTINSR